LSLAVLAWPGIRGVPWTKVRQDLGLTTGKGVFYEVFSGMATYLLSLPLLILGAIVAFLLLQALMQAGQGVPGGGAPVPGHPIFSQFKDADGWKVFQIFFLISFVAPVVEEVFFRGVLFRHLREGTKGAGPGLSFFVSALIVSFLFAVVHPQGVIGVPLLMSLAFGFTIGREWRGSIIPCVVAHAIFNSVSGLVYYNVFGG
jgi:membrane protease YdiL (CAAX protease family)